MKSLIQCKLALSSQATTVDLLGILRCLDTSGMLEHEQPILM